jgi:hypothetical protein
MAQRIRHPEWRDSLEPTNYPFSDTASLYNGRNFILSGMLLDASLYPVGGQARMYLSKVAITYDTVTIYVGDPVNAELASGSFDLINPPSLVKLTDSLGRPAGVLVSDPLRLASLQSWGVGSYIFTLSQSEFAARICCPAPQIGLRGIMLEDGTLFTGDIWLVGDDGVVLRTETVSLPSTCGQGDQSVEVIRVDVVGDPLFRRRLCNPNDLFETPRFLKTLSFTDGVQTVVCGPDDVGDVKITVNNNLAEDTVLRVRPTPDGIVFESVGDELQAVVST